MDKRLGAGESSWLRRPIVWTTWEPELWHNDDVGGKKFSESSIIIDGLQLREVLRNSKANDARK